MKAKNLRSKKNILFMVIKSQEFEYVLLFLYSLTNKVVKFEVARTSKLRTCVYIYTCTQIIIRESQPKKGRISAIADVLRHRVIVISGLGFSGT